MDGAYNWWETLDAEMSELGYYHSKADPSVCSGHANGNITITSTYTDDTTGISSSPDEEKRAKAELGCVRGHILCPNLHGTYYMLSSTLFYSASILSSHIPFIPSSPFS